MCTLRWWHWYRSNWFDQLCINIKTVFECIRSAVRKLTMAKCHFRVKQVNVLGQTLIPEGVSPQTEKVQQFLQKLKFPQIRKRTPKYNECLKYCRNYIPRLSEKSSPVSKLLKETSTSCIPNTVLDTFNKLNQQLEKSTNLALKQPIKNKQLILMLDARFTAAGYANTIHDDSNQKLQSKTQRLWVKNIQSNINQNGQWTQKSLQQFVLRFLNFDISCVEVSFLLWFSQITVR